VRTFAIDQMNSKMLPFHELIKSDKPVLVDFYADWCGPCKAMNPIISDVAKSIDGRGKVIKINIDKNVQAAQQYQVQAVPTFMIFKNGKPVWRHSGTIDKNSLLKIIQQNS
jgi:thioredoxin 1